MAIPAQSSPTTRRNYYQGEGCVDVCRHPLKTQVRADVAANSREQRTKPQTQRRWCLGVATQERREQGFYLRRRIEERNLDECATKEEIAEALDTWLGAPGPNVDVVKTVHPTRARTFPASTRINGIYFFSVYAPPRLADVQFSALLTNITEKAWAKGRLSSWATSTPGNWSGDVE
ncbi:hypothetical protein TKK_0017601 [Trichogramma kaykai]